MLNSLTQRQTLILIAAVLAATIAGAWLFQWAGYEPCELCLKQRWGYYAGIPLALIAAFSGPKAWKPLTVANFSAGQGPDWLNRITSMLGHGQPLFLALYAAMIVFFCFFYTSITFYPKETADNLKKSGGFILGIRPGEKTAEYIDWILTRITMIGAAYLVVVCMLPELLVGYSGIPFYFGGTSLLIVVSVTLDTVAQLQGHMLAQQYGKLLEKASLRSKKK